MIPEQGDLLSQHIFGLTLFTHGAIYSLWMASFPQDQKFEEEKPATVLAFWHLQTSEQKQPSTTSTTCHMQGTAWTNYVHSISYHTVMDGDTI